MNLHRIAALVAASAFIGCSSSHPLPPQSAKAPTPEEKHVYRIDFTVTANDPGKPAQSSAYTLNLEDYENGELHLGSNVQLSSQGRQDVGLKIKTSVRPMTGDDLLLRDWVEMSGIDDASSTAGVTIHKISTEGDALVRSGVNVLVASLEDPLSHKRYEVNTKVTRLR